MKTLDKLALIIRDHNEEGVCNEPECLAQDIAYAGLLLPDLPEPDRKGVWGPSWECGVEAESGLYAVRIRVGGRQFRQSSQYARLFAFALLAAANHAEGENNA